MTTEPSPQAASPERLLAQSAGDSEVRGVRLDAQRAGRPKSAEKRAAILCAASRLFLAHGLQGTSMDQVAKAAGVSKQTVYSHFENKDALFRECIRAKVASYGFDGSADLGGGDVRQVLFQVTRRFMDLIFDPEVVAMHRVVMSEAASFPRIASLFFESGPAATKGAVSGVLRQLVVAGRLRPHDSIEAAWKLLNMSFGSFHIRLLFHLIDRVPDEELDAHLRGVVDDFVRLYGVE